MAVTLIKPCYLAIFILITLSTNKSQAEQLGFYFDAHLNSPASKLNDVIGNWKSSSRGNYAYGGARMGAWFKLKSNVIFGIEKRISHYIDFTPETAFFYGQLEEESIPAGVYGLDLSVNSNSTESLFVQYEYVFSGKYLVKLKAYALIGNLVQIGRIVGQGEVGVDDSYTYQYELDYQYGEDYLFDKASLATKGYGHSFDLTLSYRYSNSLVFGLALEDFFYRIYWSPLNQERGCVARPSPVGTLCVLRSQQVSKTQQLPQIPTLFGRYKFESTELEFKVVDKARHDEIWLGLKADHLELALEGVNEVFKIGYQSEPLKVEWSFDDYRHNKANHWQISLATQWAFQ
jgi:hypothetical protein